MDKIISFSNGWQMITLNVVQIVGVVVSIGYYIFIAFILYKIYKKSK